MADNSWHPLPRFPGYHIDRTGRVYREAREMVDGHGNKRLLPGGILKVGRVHNYPTVRMRVSGKSSNYYLHRLLCETFNGPAPDGMTICRHLDDNRDNLDLDNLRWGTIRDNAHDAKRNGRLNPHRRLSADDYESIKRMYDHGTTTRTIATYYSVTLRHIRNIILNTQRSKYPRTPRRIGATT